jgi:hypothetical protein
MAAKRRFTFPPFLTRLLGSAFLVFSTYNPTGYSYFHWLVTSDSGSPALKVTVGFVIVLLYAIVVRIIAAAFHRSGMIVGALAAILLIVELLIVTLPRDISVSWQGWLVLGQYALLTAAVLVIAFGTSWSHLIERLTGQQQKRYVRSR